MTDRPGVAHPGTERPHGSHPRPDFRRADERWQPLDGAWELALGDTDDWQPVIVPSPWESARSGIRAHWVERARYRRMLAVPEIGPQDAAVLHFQAVHHRAVIWVDGRQLVEHVGGQLSFEADVSAFAGRTVELQVLVDAPIDKSEIPHGKQRSIPADPYDVCSFTPCSGIWQSVWLERRPTTYVRSVRFVPAASLDRFAVSVDIQGSADRIRVEVAGSGESVEFTPAEAAVELLLNRPRVWWPDDPQLYQVRVLLERDGSVLDAVTCTTGLRTVSVAGSVLRLNDQRLHLRGVLDQGYWPDSGWTAPDEAALEADLRAARAAGFTMVRKHLKLEDPRWLHAADRLGMLVWEEPPSVSRFSDRSVAAFEAQLAPMVARDANHPSIVVWGLYNEEWGLDWDVAGDPAKAEAVRRAYQQVSALDPTRPVVDNSGWSHVQTDLVDWHVYSPDQTTWRSVLEELHGGFDVELGPGGRQHKKLLADGTSAAGLPVLNSEYGTGRTSLERAWVMRWQTQELRRDDRSNGYVYCELYDIEHETAGVFTFGRRGKDTAGLDPADVHAETVIVLDVDPVAPGADVITTDGKIDVVARVSSHASVTSRVALFAGWGPPLSPGGRPGPAVTDLGAVMVEPYVLSAPLTVRERLPEGASSARLHLWAVDAGAGVQGGRTVAHAVLDVRLGDGGPSLH